MSRTEILKLRRHQNHQENLLNDWISGSVGLRQGQRTSISDKFPDDVVAAGLITHF